MTFDLFRTRTRRARFAPEQDPFGVPQDRPVGYDIIQPSGFIEPGVVTAPSFASTIRPIILVSSNPTLPDSNYPTDTWIYNTVDQKLYKNIGGTWEYVVGTADITSNELAANSVIAGKVAAGAISTDELAAGEITLFDETGEVFLEPTGFGATWQRQIKNGFINGDFVALPPTPANELDNSTNPLPNWSYTKASGTAVVAKSVSATGNGSQRALQFVMSSGAAGDNSYVQQIYPIVATKNRAFSFSPYAHAESSAGNVDAEAYLELQFLKKDGTTTGSAYTFARATSTLTSGGELGLGAAGDNTAPPADAYFARVRYGLRRKSGGSTSATSTMQFNEVLMLEGQPRVHIPEVTAPATWSRGSIFQNNGTIILAPDSLDLNSSGRKNVGIGDEASLSFSSSVPPAPSDGDLWFEVATNIWWVYDSTFSVWISAQLFHVPFDSAKAVAQPYSATQTGVMRQTMPFTGDSGLLIQKAFTSFHVQGGGSALGASHKWVGQVVRDTGGVLATINIDSGSSGVWRRDVQDLTQVYASSFFIHEINWTKTGTPGNLYAITTITYRLIRA